MHNIEEIKIRDILKELYDSYEKVFDFVFTTFDYDPVFFEEHIITFLMGGDRKISTIGELNVTNDWIRDNNVCVYYDKSALIAGTSCITLPAFSQAVKKGVFHPKVTVIYGKMKTGENAAHIIVSSCNLTVSGYGRNQEAFSCIKVKTVQVAKSLAEFLDKLRGDDQNRHKTVIDYLQGTSFRDDDSTEFFWNYDNEGASLLEKLSDLPEGDLQIISPYYDESGPAGLLQEIDGRIKTKIYPALDGESYNIHVSDYEALKEAGVEFANVCIYGNNPRFVHAKLIQKGFYSIVGSYNFTSAALKGANAEAALIIRHSKKVLFDECEIDVGKFKPDTEKIDDKDSVEQSGNNIHVIFVVDWGNNTLSITINQAQQDDRTVYTVKIDGVDDSQHKGWDIVGNIEEELDENTKKAILRHKQFSFFCENRLCAKGIIVELNWDGYRPELVCNSLGETISEWYDSRDQEKHKEHAYELRFFADNEEDNELERVESGAVDNSGDIFDNYFLVAVSLERLCKKIEESSEKNAKNIYGILVSKPGSMSRILDFIEQDVENDKMFKERDVVYYWLVIEYLKKAFRLLPSKCDQKEFEENYERQKGIFEDRLKNIDHRVRDRVQARPEYLEWIEKEFFNSEGANV